MRERIILSLGSNLGESRKLIERAVFLLSAQLGEVVKITEIEVTKPWGKLDQQDFYNCVVEFAAEISSQDLLELCMSVEEALGRVRFEKWGPRTMDVDILFYGDWKIDDQNLKVPHPLILERDFLVDLVSSIDEQLIEKLKRNEYKIFEKKGD
jgi:2-amino-4-hydroxy-6-hydroxymethyldihydropteridine diphosphokinase